MSLTVLITDASGNVQRLGPDEADAGWIPQNIQWGSALPGGWKESSFDLAKRSDEDVPLRLFDEVEIIDESGEPVYEGRIQQLPREHGEDFRLGVKCLGWAAHLLDDTSFREIYVDQMLDRWRTASLARTVQHINGTPAFVHSQWSVEAGVDVAAPGIIHQTTRLVSDATQQGVAESVYDSGGVPIGFFRFDFSAKNLGNGADVNWATYAQLADDELNVGGFNLGVDYHGINAAADQTLTATTATRKFVQLFSRWGGVGVGDGNWTTFWKRMGVYGTHGVPLQLTDGAGPTFGFYIDDVFANALSRACPKLNFTVGEGGSIERPALVVTQASYPDPGSVDRIVTDLNKYTFWDWLVYENRTFFYRPTDPARLTWEARMDQGVLIALEGDDAEHAFNGVIVKYQLLDGTTRTAGPVGSGMAVESAGLGDPDLENTVTQHGYQRKYAELNIGFPLASDLYATTIGAAYLAQVSLPSRSGDITLTGYVEHPTKGQRPVREVRAGDWIRLTDHPADVPRRIIETAYVEDARQCRVSVGNEIAKVDALLERLGIATSVTTGG